MLDVLIFVMIYVGVAISVYQLYDIHYNLNFEDDEKRPHDEDEDLKDLSIKAKEYAEMGTSSGFVKAVKRIFGRDFDHRIVLAAFAGEKERISAEPLLRRKKNIVCDGKIKILHVSFWKTDPPAKDIRGVLLSIVFINSLLVLFLGGLSVYTIAYEVPVNYLSWVNSEFVLMLLIYLLILATHTVSKFDIYMHDIYQIGKLNNDLYVDHAGK